MQKDVVAVSDCKVVTREESSDASKRMMEMMSGAGFLVRKTDFPERPRNFAGSSSERGTCLAADSKRLE